MFTWSVYYLSLLERGMFFREALVWRNMDHPNIQSFLGVDAQTFHPYYSMISLWQDNGTIMACLYRLEHDLGLPVLIDVWVCR